MTTERKEADLKKHQPLVVGLDVGGTNTDTVLLRGSSVLASAKVSTSANEHSGVEEAIHALFSDDDVKDQVQAVFLGTTAFVNALLEGRGLDHVAVVRLCGPSSRSLPPFVDFPLKDIVSAGTWFASGGLRFDGSEECRLNETELERISTEISQSGAHAVVVSGTFSPTDPSQEERAAKILQKSLPPSIRVTVSSKFGQLGLLGRENSAILNACLVPTARRAAFNARRALYNAGIPSSAKLYFTANDGSVISFPQAAQSPLSCVACGPTNSLRGAAFLVSAKRRSCDRENSSSAAATSMDRIVLDVGGTSTDAGCLMNGVHPRDSNAEAYIAGVRCNHRTTDVVSIALGGGSIVSNDGTTVGPESVGADITSKALCFGGTTCTATCIAIAMGATVSWSKDLGTLQTARNDFDVPPCATRAWNTMQKRFYDLVEATRTDNRPVEVVLVGGGAGLVDAERLSKALGDCPVTKPRHGCVANACGSALAQAVGEAETIADLSPGKRESVLTELKAKALALAGPEAKVIECEEVPLAYLPGKMTRVFVRATAPLDLSKQRNKEDSETPLVEERTLVESVPVQQPALRSADPPTLEPSAPNIVNGEWIISEYDAHCLAIGCGILGCGGGGSTFQGLLQLLTALRKGRPIRVVPATEIPPDSLIAPCGFMGAPSVNLETFNGPEQLVTAVRRNIEMTSSAVATEPTFITVSEIGGSNGIVPLLVGGLMDLPVVDADLMGRAFPELQMTTTSIYGLPQTPMTVSDAFGRCVTINSSRLADGLVAADEAYWTERVLRPVCVEFGCSAGLVDPLLTGSELCRVGILGSLSRARRIGDCIIRSRHSVDAIRSMLQREGGKQIFRGMIADVQRETTAGFAKGSLTVSAEDKKSTLSIQFQNEFLIAHRLDFGGVSEVLGCVPDIISILDADTARPIATEEVRFGFRVVVILLPVSILLRTEEALNVVGPRAFGLEESYKSELYEAEILHQSVTHPDIFHSG